MGLEDLADVVGADDEIAWYAADEDTGLLYCSRYRWRPGDDPPYGPVNVHVSTLTWPSADCPDWDQDFSRRHIRRRSGRLGTLHCAYTLWRT